MTGQEGPGLLHMSAAKTHAASAVMQSRTRQATMSAMPIAVCGITTFRAVMRLEKVASVSIATSLNTKKSNRKDKP